MRISIIILFLFAALGCFAQRQVTTRYLSWGALYGQYNFSPAWNVNLDAQARYEYTDNDWFVWFIRPGLTWKAKNNIQLTAGVALVALYPNPNSLPPRPEWRKWQEVGKKFVEGKHTIYPRFRFEQRFIRQYGVPVFEENFSFNTYRTRFRVDYTYTITPEKTSGFLLIAGNEYMASMNRRGDIAFDQNRAWAGFGYKLNNDLSLQLTYLNLFQRLNAVKYELHHTIRLLAVFQVSKKIKSPD